MKIVSFSVNTKIDVFLWGINNINKDREDIRSIKKFIKADKSLL